MEKQIRKTNRKQSHNYSACGTYAVTICVKNRCPLLWTDAGVREKRYELSEEGMLTAQMIRNIPEIYENVMLDRFVVMPNHVHMILIVLPALYGECADIKNIMRQLKGRISKTLGYSLWQRSFYEHLIRDEEDYRRQCRYIENNPRHWTEDDLFFDGNTPAD